MIDIQHNDENVWLPAVSIHYDKMTSAIVFTTQDTFKKVETYPEWYNYDRADKNEYDVKHSYGIDMRIIEAPEKNNTLIYYAVSGLIKEDVKQFLDRLNIPEAQLFIKDREHTIAVSDLKTVNECVIVTMCENEKPITAARLRSIL